MNTLVETANTQTLMQDMMAYSSSLVHPLLETIIASRFDLMLIGIGLMGYMILASSRDMRAAKKFHKKVDAASEDFEAADATQGVDSASVKLARVLESMDFPDHVSSITAALDTFFDEHPEYPFVHDEVKAILSFCGSTLVDQALPDMLFERIQSTNDDKMLSAFLHYYMQSEQPEKACNIYELNYAEFFDVEIDENMEWRLLMAALKCGRQSLAAHLLQTSQSNAIGKIVAIQHWWKQKSATMCETRVARMGGVLNRLASMFNERYPFEEEHSDGESTCFLGDDSDWDDDTDADSYCNEEIDGW